VVEFFLRRPVFATVCSIIILLGGLVAIPSLPIAQFPKIAPPTVTVSATYTGASAEAVESSVTTPLEESINGIQGLRYLTSTSGNDGSSTITAVFSLDRDLDKAATDVQNAITSAQGRLPNEVKLTGVTVAKNSGSFIMALGVWSENPNFTSLNLSNYADLNIRDELRRIPGVGDVIIFGERKYAMRIWVDPRKLADRGLSAGDVVAALQDQNVQVAAGKIGAPPTTGNQPYEYPIKATGRLTDVKDFENVILSATPDGGYVRLGEVSRIEIGAENYATNLRFDGREAIGIGIRLLANGNALDVSRQVIETMDRLSQRFPVGVHYKVAFDSTDFVRNSINDVVFTLFVAVALVVFVIFLFLQDWRTTLIPSITIPISLIGTFGLMKLLNFSINTLTLFGLTLATGLVVDDAIVVIENIARFIREKKMEPLAAASAAMKEISGAVVATSLVLLSVFIPVGFFPGTTGLLYKQFALTIACSISISLFNALTLTPVLSALFLRKHEDSHRGFFGGINAAIDATRHGYHSLLPRVLRARTLVLVLFVGALGLTWFVYKHTPGGFVPDEDQGFLIVSMQNPEGTSADQMLKSRLAVEEILKRQPEIVDVFDVGGFGFTGNGSNKATMFVRLVPLKVRGGGPHSVGAVIGRLYGEFGRIPGTSAFPINPPAIQGLGLQGGFAFQLQDRGGVGLKPLAYSAYGIMGMAAKEPALARVYTTFSVGTPELVARIDREKAKSLGIPLANVFDTMQVYLGSLYVNDFDYLNRSYRVYVQADAPYRSDLSDFQHIYVRSNTNGVTPLASLMQTRTDKTAPVITHFNLFRSVEIDGAPSPGHGSGDAIAAMQKIFNQISAITPGLGYEWSGISREQIEGGTQAALIFVLGIIFTFLVLAAQYESFIDPLIILLAVPLAMLGALAAIGLRAMLPYQAGGISDVYAQIGFLMLIGLASKNAILIVEFANQLRKTGLDEISAVRQAAETRLRPILMTSIAFILGIFPLVIANGDGAAARNSLGTAVFGGMIVSTFLNLFVVPVLYVFFVRLEDRVRGNRDIFAQHGLSPVPLMDGKSSKPVPPTSPPPTTPAGKR
jgi:HAE1 family hydrophobic/amphiphilic exporter-1